MKQDKVKELRQQISDLKNELRNEIIKKQLRCKHLRLAELSGSPPYRICLNCGMTEEGWGPGYQVLHGVTKSPPKSNGVKLEIPGIHSSDFFALRQGLVVLNHLKGPLIRREVSLRELIRNYDNCDKIIRLY